MSLLSTADAVLHLTLQCLPLKDIIAFARCSPQTMRIASSPVVFQHVCLQRVLVVDATTTILSSRLLHHASFAVRVLSPKTLACIIEPALDCVLELGVIRELDLTSMQTTQKHVVRLLKHPSMCRLQALRMSVCFSRDDINAATVNIIAALPELHSLHLENSRGQDDDRWTAMPLLLSSLHLADGIADPRSCPPSVAPPRFERLQHLSLVHPSFGRDRASFRALFASAFMQHLVTLKIDRMDAAEWFFDQLGPINPVDYCTAFSGLRCLTTLQLIQITDVSVLLPALALAPALHRLELTFYSTELAPTVAALSALMREAPGLEVLVISPECVCASLRTSMRDLLELHVDRLSLRVLEG